MPFAHELQKVVVNAFDKGLIQICYVAGTIVLIGAVGAAILCESVKKLLSKNFIVVLNSFRFYRGCF